jgi:hypothetical protein
MHLNPEPATTDPPREPSWEDTIPKIEPLIYRVHAGDSLGTAFVVAVSGPQDGGRHLAFATAWHVVKDVVTTDDPLDLIDCKGRTLVSPRPSMICPVGPPECDSALMLVPTEEPLLGSDALLPIPLRTMLPRGAELGWLGFPGLTYPELCFFKGVVSGHREGPSMYLVDGVAVNGVSGGPAFDRSGLLVGLFSSYLPNRRGDGATLPGLLIVVPLNLIRFWMQEILGATVMARRLDGKANSAAIPSAYVPASACLPVESAESDCAHARTTGPWYRA